MLWEEGMCFFLPFNIGEPVPHFLDKSCSEPTRPPLRSLQKVYGRQF